MSDNQDEYIDLPQELIVGNDDLAKVQSALTQFVTENRKLGKRIHLMLDEDLLMANSDPWSPTSYKTSSAFAIMYADKISINYRGETKVVKGGNNV